LGQADPDNQLSDKCSSNVLALRVRTGVWRDKTVICAVVKSGTFDCSSRWTWHCPRRWNRSRKRCDLCPEDANNILLPYVGKLVLLINKFVFLDFFGLGDFVMCWQCSAWMKTNMAVR